MKPTKEQLVKRYINLVYYYTKQWVSQKTDTDDMVQETYRKAFMKYTTFMYQSENQLKSWLLTICRHTIIDAHKQKYKTLPIDEEIENSLEDTTQESWIESEIKKEQIGNMAKVLKQLPSHEHDIIRMRYFDEFSFKEIATILHASEATVKMRCYRTLTKLRKEIEQ